MVDEVWKPIEGHPKYVVSNRGRIRSFMRNYKQPLILRLSKRMGYYFVSLASCMSGGKNLSVHRLVLKAFVGPPPDGFECNHKDGIKSNNNLSNLEWVSRSDNTGHAYQMGFSTSSIQVGENHPHAKLNNNQVREIKKLLAQGVIRRKIAEKFNVSKSNINNIATGYTWSHITV